MGLFHSFKWSLFTLLKTCFGGPTRSCVWNHESSWIYFKLNPIPKLVQDFFRWERFDYSYNTRWATYKQSKQKVVSLWGIPPCKMTQPPYPLMITWYFNLAIHRIFQSFPSSNICEGFRSSVVFYWKDPGPRNSIYRIAHLNGYSKLTNCCKSRSEGITRVLRDSVYHGKATAPEITHNNKCEQRSHILHIWIQVCFELKKSSMFYPVLLSYVSRHPSTPPHSSHRMRHRPG